MVQRESAFIESSTAANKELAQKANRDVDIAEQLVEYLTKPQNGEFHTFETLISSATGIIGFQNAQPIFRFGQVVLDCYKYMRESEEAQRFIQESIETTYGEIGSFSILDVNMMALMQQGVSQARG